MITSLRKRLTLFLRLLLCAVFVALAIRGVAIHDRVSFHVSNDPDSAIEVGRLKIERTNDVIVKRADGTEASIPRSRIAKDEGGQDLIERGLLTAFRETDKVFVLLAIVIFAPVTPLQGWRLWIMLRAQDIHIPLIECIKISFGGNFLNYVFMIGTTSGDVFKIYCAASHTETHKTEAVATILLDRAVGLVGLLLVMSVAGLGLSNDPVVRRIGTVAFLICSLILVALAVFSANWMRALAPTRLMAKLPWADHFRRMFEATCRLTEHRGLVFGAIGLAAVLQTFAIGAFVSCARALHMDFSGDKVWDYFSFIATGHVVAAIPISAQGLGTMELTYKTLFLGTHGTLSQLLCLAIWVRLLQLLWSLPGVAVTMIGGWRKKGEALIANAELPLDGADPPLAEPNSTVAK
ncbi:MAG: flippase-like domain-containing protein [Phycisphaerales bacterium]|nr:flippase-like domain-containing protein [Phycisphaerales bacterium]